jgi:RNA polymerase sigma-70 factor (ECF subfamily)
MSVVITESRTEPTPVPVTFPVDSAARRSAPSRRSYAGLRRAERELVLGLIDRRPEAFDELDRGYRERVRRFALKRLRDPVEAEDVCQDVFLDVHRSIDTFEGRSSFTTWLFGIAHHQVHRRFRRRGRDHVSLESQAVEDLAVERPRMEQRVDAARALEDVARTLEEDVAPRHQEIFHLRYRDGLATRDIAEEIGRSNQSVKISLFRTRRTIEARSSALGELLAAS